MNASETIRKIRRGKDYSQEYMAHQLGISQNAYSKLERGNTKLTVDRLEQIANVLETSVQGILHPGGGNTLDQAKKMDGLVESKIRLLGSMMKGLFDGKEG